MSTVTSRIKEIKQPRGGYIKPSQFDTVKIDDGNVLAEKENVHASIVGMVVDYMSRFLNGTDKKEAFRVSLKGAKRAEEFENKDAFLEAIELLDGIVGLDDNSIICACKLVSYDVWFRNPLVAMMSLNADEINPDADTVHNIKVLIQRSIAFFKKCGQIIKDGFTFEPPKGRVEDYEKMVSSGEGTFGGYTATVSSGDGDFLTADTIWDFKVSKTKPTNKHTLQLLMYWIMGQHSGQDIYKNITKIGIFNPRLNMVFILDIKSIPEEVIKTIEEEVICY